jgi:hypothetical protein
VKIIKISGTDNKRGLAEFIQAGIQDSWLLALERGSEDEEPATGEQIEEWLRESGLVNEAPVVLDTNEPFTGLETCITIFATDFPLETLEPRLRTAAGGADLVVVDFSPAFEAESERGLEASVKQATGAGKVLIYHDCEEKERAYKKALDLALGSVGIDDMPQDIPQNVIEAVKAAAVEGRVECEKAHDIASELGVPLEMVGRALDLQQIKITRCQLGCF